ncbi:hypothetical protein, partial [Escherichia coli]
PLPLGNFNQALTQDFFRDDPDAGFHVFLFAFLLMSRSTLSKISDKKTARSGCFTVGDYQRINV